MNRRIPLFDVISNDDLTCEKLEEIKQIILHSSWDRDNHKHKVISDLDVLFKIAKCKHDFNDMLENEDLMSIVKFLEQNYYNQEELLKRADNILKFMFVPLYYRDDKEYIPNIPQEFWSSALGKLIISCLSANDDILLSTTEAGKILDYKRQNMNVMAKEGKLPAKRVGGNLVFRLFDVLTYKKQQERNRQK